MNIVTAYQTEYDWTEQDKITLGELCLDQDCTNLVTWYMEMRKAENVFFTLRYLSGKRYTKDCPFSLVKRTILVSSFVAHLNLARCKRLPGVRDVTIENLKNTLYMFGYRITEHHYSNSKLQIMDTISG